MTFSFDGHLQSPCELFKFGVVQWYDQIYGLYEALERNMNSRGKIMEVLPQIELTCIASFFVMNSVSRPIASPMQFP